jgi:cytochrome c oxidase subunit 2
MYAWSVMLYNENTQIPDDAEEVFVVGKQWMWKIQHENGVREINELHLPADRAVRVTGTSEDVIHDFGIPAFRNTDRVDSRRSQDDWRVSCGRQIHTRCGLRFALQNR